MYKCVLVFLAVVTIPVTSKELGNGVFSCSSKLDVDSLKEFKCRNNSGCIKMAHVCDGIKHCPDASDEIFCLQSRKRFKRSNTCVLPANPKFGIYKVLNNPNARPGQSFDTLVLTVRCYRGYGVVNKDSSSGNSSEVFCISGEWYQDIPQCVRFCKLDPDPSVRYMCHVPGVGLKVCDNYVAPGTLVSPMCNSPVYYSTDSFPKMKCIMGFWNYVAQCKAECGRVSPEAVQLTLDGKEAKRGELPWHVGIYLKGTNTSQQICGGTLISNNVVLSAARCFLTDRNKLQSTSKFEVAIAKHYHQWNSTKDVDVQKSDIKQVKFPTVHADEGQSLKENLAIVILATSFVYKAYVRPVCLNFDSNFETWQLKEGNTGKIAGWGLTTAEDNESQIIKVVDMPFINESLCIRTLPSSFREYINGDKFCAGYTNGTVICKNDIGSGLAFVDTEKGVDRFYLRGIASAAPHHDDNACNDNTYTTFIKVTKHQEFIRNAIAENDGRTCPFYSFQCRNGSCADHEADCEDHDFEDESDESDELYNPADNTDDLAGTSNVCILPDYPDHGTYEVLNNTNARPGQFLDTVVLTVRCWRGYGIVKKDGTHRNKEEVFCLNGEWYQSMPKCVRYCKLDTDPSVRYMCHVPGVGLKICPNYVAPGTSVSPICNSPVYYSTESLPSMKCTLGFWNYVALCKAECGRVSPEALPLVVDGQVAKRGELPWHVGIYEKKTNTSDQICGGSLISNNVVLSAAHCFWSDVNELLPASKFAVAIGKLYRLWNSKEDADIQNSDVKEIKIPNLFEGETANFQEDLAILILKTPFVYKTYVRPVCLSFDSTFEKWQLKEGNTGKVAGWGLTAANGEPSPILKVVDMPFINELNCIRTLPSSFRQYVTGDKFCAGYTNGTALCKGDSGGGLAFVGTEKGIDRYYLRGIVSAAPRSDDLCNIYAYTTFTRIKKHQEFINDAIAESASRTCPFYSFQCDDGSCVDQGADCDGKPDCADGSDESDELCRSVEDTNNLILSSGVCVLPSYPNHGSYLVTNISDARPGQVLENVDLIVTCSKGYDVIDKDGVTGNNTKVYCNKGTWNRSMPKCVPSTCKWEGVNGRCVPPHVCLSTLDEKLGRPKPPLCTSPSDDTPLICCTDCELVKDSRLLLFNPVLGILTKTGTSKAKDKCQEYIHTLDYPCKKNNTEWNITMQLDPDMNCFRKVKVKHSVDHITERRDALRGEHPHIAIFGYRLRSAAIKWYCAGTVISERYILTSAWCLTHHTERTSVTYIALGVLKKSDPIEPWQRYKVKRTIPHPEYRRPSYYHNIGLLETNRRIAFSSAVLPACLHEDDETDKNQYALGWSNADTLFSSPLIKLTDEVCASRFPPTTWILVNGYDNSTQVCYGIVYDPITGNNGGPLMSQDHEQCVHTIIGLDAYGEFCNAGVCATIYTRVKPYVPWIEDIVWP